MLNAIPILRSKVMQTVPSSGSATVETTESPNLPASVLIEPWYTKTSYILIAASMVSVLVLGTAIALKK